jgi:hypothetical protein
VKAAFCLLPEYNSWRAMVARCSNPNNIRYREYGGRGIRVCERWLRWRNFIADMGRKPSASHSIERINRDGGYDPTNCRWADREEQARNKGNSRHVVLDGESMSLTVAADRLGISYKAAHHRLTRGTLR